MAINKRLISYPSAAAGAAFTPSENFNTVLYTGNGGTQRIGGYINRGAVFNGSNSQISLPTNAGLTFGSSATYTISMWINLPDVSSTDRIFTNILGTTTENQVAFGIVSNRFFIFKTLGTQYNATNANAANLRTPTNSVTADTWMHIVLVMDSGTITFYIDNSSQTITSEANTFTQIQTNTLIGQDGNNVNYLDGTVDQVRLFNKALSSSEVTTLYGETHASTTISTTDIFSDNSGVALYQLDGNANDTGGTHNGTASNIVYQEATHFQPDLVWIKNRDQNDGHRLQDVLRGTNYLETNSTSVQLDAFTAGITTFDSNGFTVGAGNSYNTNNEDYVAWCWNAGTNAAADNTDGTSITSTVKANTAAGFSIVRYTAGSSKDYTQAVGHGLDSAPKMIIQKRTGTTSSAWYIIFTALDGSVDYMSFDDGTKNDMSGSDSGFTIGTDGFSDWWGSSYNIINYCFHDVTDYQKIGSYSGTGVASGNIIETGFEIAFLIIKRTDTDANWRMLDNKRSTTNPRDKELFPNLANPESTFDAVNFLSNGFELATTDANYNNSSGTYLYLAIAADPDTTAPVVANSFDIATYTGTGGARDVSTNFKPDLVWIKERNSTSSHGIHDSVRGATHFIGSNHTNADNTNSQGLTSFNDDGFSVGNAGYINESSSRTYVAWTWKAGDHDDNLPQINTEGSIDSVVSVNDEAGFSIVKYTGTGANATVGHGQSAAPEFIIVKNLDQADDWAIYHTSVGNTKYLQFDTGSPVDNVNWWNDTSPTSTTFSIGTDHDVNANNEAYIAYCWRSITGYSKIGSYTQTSSGTLTVDTGINLDFVLYKSAGSSGGGWGIVDTVRGDGKRLFPHSSTNESTSQQVTISGTSFSIPYGVGGNAQAGATGIYMAFKIN